MKKAILFLLASLVMLAVFFLNPSAGETRKPKVTAEPLSCYAQDDRLICFDAPQTTGQIRCVPLDKTTVYCTSA